MDEEVEKNRTLRESLELEKQIFRQRLLAVENLSEVVDSGDEIVEHAQEQPRFKILSVCFVNMNYYDITFCLLKREISSTGNREVYF